MPGRLGCALEPRIVERLIFKNVDMPVRARHVSEQEIDSSAWGITYRIMAGVGKYHKQGQSYYISTHPRDSSCIERADLRLSFTGPRGKEPGGGRQRRLVDHLSRPVVGCWIEGSPSAVGFGRLGEQTGVNLCP
jgi:hypothetical protein